VVNRPGGRHLFSVAAARPTRRGQCHMPRPRLEGRVALGSGGASSRSSESQ